MTFKVASGIFVVYVHRRTNQRRGKGAGKRVRGFSRWVGGSGDRKHPNGSKRFWWVGKKFTVERKPTTTTTAFLPLPYVDTISNIQTLLTLRLGALCKRISKPPPAFSGAETL